MENWIEETGAKEFPGGSRTFLADDFGAVGDGITLNTSAIQKAIDTAAAAGGGKVTFSPGVYLSATLRLEDNINLEIPRGTTLAASENPADYPEHFTRHAGIELKTIAPLILIDHCRNAAVTGSGTVDGQGKRWWKRFWEEMLPEYEKKGLRWCVDYDCARPKSLVIQNSGQITVKDVVFQRAAHWTLHILYSSHVTVENIIICNNIQGHGPSTDGVDIDSSEYVRVADSTVSCNDDNFCLKSGRDADGLRINRPCCYVLIENCRALTGAGLVTIGSETSGGFHHISVRRCSCKGTRSGLRFKSTATRGGRICDITFEDIVLDSPRIAFEMDLDWFPAYGNCQLPPEFRGKEHPRHWDVLLTPVFPPERGIPVLEEITFRNIRAQNAQICCQFLGSEQITPRHLRFEHVHLQGEKGGIIRHIQADFCEDFRVEAKFPLDDSQTTGLLL